MTSDPDYNPNVPMHVPASLVHDFNIRDYQSRDPFVAAHELVNGPVPEVFWTRHLGGHWLVKGAEAVRAVERSGTVFSTERMFFPDYLNPRPEYAFAPMQTDPPEHAKQRAVINPLFFPARIARLQQSLHSESAKLVARIAQRKECNFIEEYAGEFPVITFLRLTDLPVEDRFQLRAIAHRFLSPTAGTSRSSPMQELLDYLLPIVDSRLANPGKDILSEILALSIREKQLARRTVIMLAATVLFGGLDTVSAALGFFAYHLAQFPEARHRLADDPGVVPRAVEEILRRYGVPNISRQVKQDTVFRGVELHAGEHVAWSSNMYNLDERVFPNALSVDFNRKRSTHHTFGNGIHHCPGANLARAQLKTFAETWLAQIPEFHLRPEYRLRYRAGHNITLEELPIVMGAA